MTELSPRIADTPVDSPIRFERLWRTELRKLVDTRASRWLLIAIVVLDAAVAVVMLFVAEPNQLTFNKMIDFASTPEKVLLPAVGILAMTSEWSQRTGLVTFTLEPRRTRVIVAKVLAALALGLVVSGVMFLEAALGNVLGAAIRGGDGSWSFGLSGFLEITLVQTIGLLAGLAFGAALLTSAAAVVFYYVVPNVWSAVLAAATPLSGASAWVDLNKAAGNLYNQQITAQGWLQLLVAVTLWIATPAAIGVWRISHTEVKFE